LRIVEHDTARGHHRLLPVVVGHLPAEFRKSSFDVAQAGFVQLQQPAGCGSDGTARHVIDRRTEAARADDDIGARKRVRNRYGDAILVVAD